ncbi:MAG TPA: ABC transporter ATP-binding protein [Thermomicrobiales bacterium]|nr:ABC transporter ATP-binding protein [Thermomicrobiales bacterium]
MQDAPFLPTGPSGGASIVATGVGRRFLTPAGHIDAVRDVNLSVAQGEFCVVVGPSGCGKSTFLRMAAGLDTPTSGVLELSRPDGRIPTNAVVFQGRSLFPWLTVRDNLAYGLNLRGVGRSTQRDTTDRLLAILGLSQFGDLYPHQISEGMRQRVAIGRALAVDPDLLLMDEPFGALDEQTRYILQEELLRIWDQSGKTVVFITHSIDEAIVLADRIVVMSAQPGTIRAVIDVPLPRPRSLMDVRSSPEFGRLFTQTWELLKDEVTRARLSQEGALA